MQNGKYTPCREGEQGENKSWLDFKDQSQLDIGVITKQDFVTALKRTKPSVDGNQLKEYEDFTKTFGQDGWFILLQLQIKALTLSFSAIIEEHWFRQ